MKLRTLLAMGALALSTFAGLAQADNTGTTQPVPYHYGMPLHVAKVISMTEQPSQECKVITADMKFIDTAGKPAEISYLKLSDSCNFNN
ncbi:DUF2790 domain-containing protein [Pseudomonas sp. MWU13-2100]|uniref:DUF2790 domain-containing protein n=1 Tax=Pseudomonas sp. MWU13-2100 TaxID=2935075 RepID=UPI00200C3677|nr:DUF2790 domain-containing protein [Pseudomonas sp. MWU13-2100]